MTDMDNFVWARTSMGTAALGYMIDAVAAPLQVRPRVMIVEDYVLIQESIRLVLERDCDVVATAEDAESALAMATELRPDLVTIDVSLPDFNGFTVMEKMLSANPGVNVIFVTAHSEQNYIERAFAAGAKGYVLKGSIQTELPAAIREVMAGRRFVSPLARGRFNLKV